MKKILTLVLASTALTAAIGLPAWSAIQAPADGGLRPIAALPDEGPQGMPLVLASDDDDDRGWRDGSRRGHDDEDEDEDEDEDDDEDDDECDDDDDCGDGASNPAPAGAVAPPQNGLFGNGAPPQVQVN
jgi:hypothetical protein